MSRTPRIRGPRDLGAVVAEARRLRGLTQHELAASAGLERGYLARIETGASVILLDRIFRLLRRLGVEVTATLPEPPTDASAPTITPAVADTTSEANDGAGDAQ